MGRSQYRFDRRNYRGVFKPGFFAHLNSTKFWQTDNDPFQKSRKRRRRVWFVTGFIVAIALVWVIIESSRALSLF